MPENKFSSEEVAAFAQEVITLALSRGYVTVIFCAEPPKSSEDEQGFRNGAIISAGSPDKVISLIQTMNEQIVPPMAKRLVLHIAEKATKIQFDGGAPIPRPTTDQEGHA